MYETVEDDPASVETYTEIVYVVSDETEAENVGLAAVVDDREPPDALQWYVPPLTSSKLTPEAESVTVCPESEGFGEPETPEIVGARGAPE